MIKFNFVPARDELNIVLENIHDPEFSDVNFLVNNIGYYQNIINNLKDFNLNNEVDAGFSLK